MFLLCAIINILHWSPEPPCSTFQTVGFFPLPPLLDTLQLSCVCHAFRLCFSSYPFFPSQLFCVSHLSIHFQLWVELLFNHSGHSMLCQSVVRTCFFVSVCDPVLCLWLQCASCCQKLSNGGENTLLPQTNSPGSHHKAHTK